MLFKIFFGKEYVLMREDIARDSQDVASCVEKKGE